MTLTIYLKQKRTNMTSSKDMERMKQATAQMTITVAVNTYLDFVQEDKNMLGAIGNGINTSSKKQPKKREEKAAQPKTNHIQQLLKSTNLAACSGKNFPGCRCRSACRSPPGQNSITKQENFSVSKCVYRVGRNG